MFRVRFSAEDRPLTTSQRAADAERLEKGERVSAIVALRGALPRRWQVAIAAVILGELLVRGPIRALRASHDLTVQYGAARVWVQGGNPYDVREVGDAFEAGGGPRNVRPTDATMPSVYPPVTFAIEAPLAFLRWRTAVLVFAAGALALAVLAVLRVTRHAGLAGERAATAVLGALALAPLHTGLGAGQVAIPSASLLLLGWTLREERPAWAGVLVACGTALKPTLGIPFLLACMLRPTRRLAFAGVAVLGGLFALGVARLHIAGHGWIGEWLGAVRAAAGPSGMNYVRPEASGSIPMIHLEMLLWRVIPNSAAVTALSLAAILPAAAFAAWRLRLARDRATDLLSLGTLCVASLLVMYHRTYDAFLLTLPLAAVLACWNEVSRPLRVALAACFASFLQPGAPVLGAIASAGKIPAWLSGSSVWRVLLVPHQIWALLALEFMLVVLLARHEGAASRARSPAPSEAVASVDRSAVAE
jgi:Glycosyltransferase family 87